MVACVVILAAAALGVTFVLVGVGVDMGSRFE